MKKILSPDWKVKSKKFQEIGRGGEAIVYQIRDDLVAKVFHQPDAKEFKGDSQLQQAARVKIREMQKKLLAYPSDLPKNVSVPVGVLVDRDNEIFGYVTSFIKGVGLDKFGQTSSTLKPAEKVELITRLYDLVAELHAKGVQIGDFNDANVIVDEKTLVPYLIDSDSYQFDSFQCRTFTPRFVAPEVVNTAAIPKKEKSKTSKSVAKVGSKEKKDSSTAKVGDKEVSSPLVMVKPHDSMTDWYSFLVIVMRLITGTDPFGGVVEDMDLRQRIRKNVTVFDPRVIYPVVALPLRQVPRPILEVFYRVFKLGQRFTPARGIFESLLTPVAEPVSMKTNEPNKSKKPKTAKRTSRK